MGGGFCGNRTAADALRYVAASHARGKVVVIV
jgi:hypothetical protein